MDQLNLRTIMSQLFPCHVMDQQFHNNWMLPLLFSHHKVMDQITSYLVFHLFPWHLVLLLCFLSHWYPILQLFSHPSCGLSDSPLQIALSFYPSWPFFLWQSFHGLTMLYVWQLLEFTSFEAVNGGGGMVPWWFLMHGNSDVDDLWQTEIRMLKSFHFKYVKEWLGITSRYANSLTIAQSAKKHWLKRDGKSLKVWICWCYPEWCKNAPFTFYFLKLVDYQSTI